MKTRKEFCFWGLLVAVILIIAPRTWAQPKPGTQAPIITHSFAVERGYYGYIWKVYIEAEDPDGDMAKIAASVDQVGYGNYPTSWTILKPQYRNHLKGYLEWLTFSSRAANMPEWTQITLTVSVFDKAGNESNEVAFPFTFETGVRDPYKYKLPSPFDQGDLPRLGHISIELYNPSRIGDGGKDD
jgi:hypothetical protein